MGSYHVGEFLQIVIQRRIILAAQHFHEGCEDIKHVPVWILAAKNY